MKICKTFYKHQSCLIQQKFIIFKAQRHVLQIAENSIVLQFKNMKVKMIQSRISIILLTITVILFQNVSTQMLICSSPTPLTNLKGDGCLASCPFNQRDDGMGLCVCQVGKVISLDGNSCIDNCGPLGSPNGGKCQCVIGASLVPKTNKMMACKCDSPSVPNIAQQTCIPIPSCGALFLSADKNQCVLSCIDIGEYLSTDGISCVKDCAVESKILDRAGLRCVSSCVGNEEPKFGQCQCKSGFKLNMDCSTCVLDCPSPTVQVLGSCVCPPPTLKIADPMLCISPLQCSKIGIISGNTCTKCEGLTKFISLDSKSCVEVCPYAQRLDGNKCVCQTNTFISLDLRSCVVNCGELATLNPTTSTCQCVTGAQIANPSSTYNLKCQCISPLIPSVGNDQCISPIQCVPLRYLSSDLNQCVDDCTLIGEFLDTSGTFCVSDCGTNTLNAAGKKCVEQCGPNEDKFNGQCVCDSLSKFSMDCSECVNICPPPTIPNGEPTNQCICPPTDPIMVLGTLECVDKTQCLNRGFFVSSDGTKCVQLCSDINELKLGTGACTTSCTPPKILNLKNNECVDECGNNQESDSGQCKCKWGFVQDMDSMTCVKLCPKNSHLSQDSCVCDDGFVISIDSLSCISYVQCLQVGVLNNQLDRCVLNCQSIEAILDPLGFICLPFCNPPQNFLNLDQTQCICDCGLQNAFIGADHYSCVSKCPGPFESDGITCVNGKECPFGKYLDGSGTRCVESCGTLIPDSSLKKCVKQCSDIGEVLNVEGTGCLKNCPSVGFLDIAGTKCVKFCALLNADANRCLDKCPLGQFLNVAESQCVKTCDCKGQTDTIAVNLQRNKCVDLCGPNQIEDQTGKCVCRQDKVKASDGASCLDQCPPGQVPVNGQCKACAPKFLSLKKDMCVQNCKSGGILNLAETMCVSSCGLTEVVNSQGTQCESQCPNGQTTINNICVKCAKQCKTCKGAVDKCQTCITGTVLYGDNCVSTLCLGGCKTCLYSNKSSCLTCKSKLFLSNGKCVPCTNPGQLISGKQCVSCPQYCNICSTTTDCQQCADNYGLSAGICRKCKDPYCKRCEKKSTNCVEYFEDYDPNLSYVQP